MVYRIGEMTLNSEVSLPSFSAFACEPAEADVTLTLGGALPTEGDARDIGGLTVTRLPEAWLLQPPEKKDIGLIVSEDYTRLRLAGPAALAQDSRAEWLVRVALECLLIRRGYVSLHAAAVSLDGDAYAFTAPSGTGKSTRAAAWQAAFGAGLISGDRPLIRVDTLTLYGVPWDGKEQCFRNVQFPLRAICEVRRSKAVHARAMSFEKRRRLLLQQSFLPMWDPETSAVHMMNLTRLARSALIVRMYGGPQPGDAAAMRRSLDQREWETEVPDMKARSGFALRNVVGENILMPTGDNIGQYHGTLVMNEVAAFVWKKLQSPISEEELLTAIQDEYAVDQAVAARDLSRLLEKLKSYGLIEED